VRTGFTTTTYEVLVNSGGRWTIDSVHAVRSQAIQQADSLLSSGRCEGVKVTAQKDSSAQETVIFERMARKPEKAISITPIRKAPVCRGIDEYYEFKSRRTIGRLLRQYLDEHGITPLELLYSVGHLNMLARNDTLFPQAIQSVAALQAKETGEKPTQRSGELSRAFEAVRDRARTFAGSREFPKELREKGLDALMATARATVAPDMQAFYVRGSLAARLGDGGDWSDKLELMIGLAEQASAEDTRAYVDEAAAEILDAASAIMELIGGQPDAASAHRALVKIALGRYRAPKSARSCVGQLNDLMARKPLPLTRRMLLERVARELAGVKPLTREGGEAEQNAFLGLFQELIDDGGLMGGPDISEAMTLRGKMALGGVDGDLPVDQAIERLLALLPNRAQRIGFLLDLSQTGLGQKSRPQVLTALAKPVSELTSAASLVAEGSPPEALARAVSGLRERLGMETLPAEMREAFGAALDRLLAGGKPAAAGDAAPAEAPKPSAKAKPGQPGRRAVAAGDIVFVEGEVGDEAYMINSGKIEIFHATKKGERVVGTAGPGDIIGEMSLIDNKPRMAAARAVEDTEMVVLTREFFQTRLARLEKSDRLFRWLFDVYVARLRGTRRDPD
jgi:hypothetical protein